MRVARSVDISVAPETAFSYIADVARWGEWAAAVTRCATSDGQPLRAGAELNQELRMFGRTQHRTATVVGFDPPRRIDYAMKFMGSPETLSYAVQPREAGCRVTCETTGSPKGVLKVLMPLLTPAIGRTVAGELQALKASLEGGPD